MSLFAFATALFLIVAYVWGIGRVGELRINQGEIIELVLYLLVATFGGLALNKYMEKPTVYHITRCCKCECKEKGDDKGSAEK